MYVGMFLFGVMAVVCVLAFMKMRSRSGQWDE